jgi:hypothetical protein
MSTLEFDEKAMLEALEELIIEAFVADPLLGIAAVLEPSRTIRGALLTVMDDFDSCPTCAKLPNCPLYKLWMSLPVHHRDQLRAAYLEDVAAGRIVPLTIKR